MPHIEILTDIPFIPRPILRSIVPIKQSHYVYFDGDITIDTQISYIPTYSLIVSKEVYEFIQLTREKALPIIIHSGNKPVADYRNSVGPRRTGQVLFDGKPIGRKGFAVSLTDMVVAENVEVPQPA